MDDYKQQRPSNSRDRQRLAEQRSADAGTTPSAPPKEQTNQERPDSAQHGRFTLELRTPDGQSVSATSSSSAWRALHVFAGWASQDLGKRMGTGASARLSDADGVYGVQLEVDRTGANQLKFDSDDGWALYKQVYRERQMAMSLGLINNRIEAVPPELDRPKAEFSSSPEANRIPAPTSARNAERGGSSAPLRETVLEQLQQLPRPETTDERQQRQQDRLIVEKASIVQLGLIAAELNKGGHSQLRKVLDQVQREVEASVVPPRLQTPIHGDPPIRERFTTIEHTWRTDYWQRDRPDRLGFTETWLTLKTAEHSAAVIMGMVDRARERGWKKLHLDGSAEFNREAWILATARGLQTSGYTATLGDREAVKSEQQRLSQASRDRETHTRAHQQTPRPEDSLAQATQSSSDRSPGRRRQAPLDAAITKAMHESRVPPALQARLREMIATEALRRQATAPQWRAQVYDPTASRKSLGPDLSARAVKPDRQRER